MQAGVAEELLGMLESSSAQARAVACACLGDLAQAHPPVQLHLSQVTSSGAYPCQKCFAYFSTRRFEQAIHLSMAPEPVGTSHCCCMLHLDIS